MSKGFQRNLFALAAAGALIFTARATGWAQKIVPNTTYGATTAVSHVQRAAAIRDTRSNLAGTPAGAPAVTGSAAIAPQPAQPHNATSTLTLEQRIAKLPPLTNTGINVEAQSQAILAHLSEILRFYRSAATKIQKAGEPSDILYAEQSKAQATQIAQLAFESARNEAALLMRVNAPATAAVESQQTAMDAATASPAQRIAAAKIRVTSQITTLQQQSAQIATQLAHANAKSRPALLQKQEQIQGGLELERATLEALNQVAKFSDAHSDTGLAGDIDRLANSAPELTAGTGKSITAPALENVVDAQQQGLVTQASVLFDLLTARRSIDGQIEETDHLRKQAEDLRAPILKMLRSTIAQGQSLTQQTVNLPATPTTDAQDLANTRKQFDQLTSTFRVLADAMLPLSQEVVVLQAERGTLSSWRIAIDTEYTTILRALLIRLGSIALALLVLVGLSTLWGHATVKYVHDLRRRRQLLVVRRVVVGFVGGLIVLFGFITQFSSLATFAGFISAGIAVGLQTILLSVAAYFFIIGRYGVRVGDRITVAGVTGTVIEVGLARFYMMELAGTGTELHSTGRVAVFANSVLFQTGTPLYKQLPGTEYAWHELTAKLKPEADAQQVKAALVDIVSRVYETYRTGIESQQHQIQTWLGAALDSPKVESHLRLADDGLQVAVLFPVQIDKAAETDAAIAAALVQAEQLEGPLRQGLATMPSIKAAIKN